MNYLSNYAIISKVRSTWKKDPLLVIAVTSGSVVLAEKLLKSSDKLKDLRLKAASAVNPAPRKA